MMFLLWRCIQTLIIFFTATSLTSWLGPLFGRFSESWHVIGSARLWWRRFCCFLEQFWWCSLSSKLVPHPPFSSSHPRAFPHSFDYDLSSSKLKRSGNDVKTFYLLRLHAIFLSAISVKRNGGVRRFIEKREKRFFAICKEGFYGCLMPLTKLLLTLTFHKSVASACFCFCIEHRKLGFLFPFHFLLLNFIL